MRRRIVGWAVLGLLALPGCGDDDAGPPDDGGSDVDVGLDGDADAGGDAGGDADVEPDVEPDVPADTSTDVSDVPVDPWDVVVNVQDGTSVTPVNLSSLPRGTFGTDEGVLLSDVVDAAAPASPWPNTYDFIGSDGFDPLVERLAGDRGQLPFYGELALGYLYWEADQLRVNWDATLGFPGSLRVRGMDGGTIRLMPMSATEVFVRGGGGRALVDLATRSTVNVVDPRHPDDGEQPMVPLDDLLTAASVTGASALVYKLYGADGFTNADDNLMPHANLTHGYIKPADRGVVLEDGFDSTGRSWRIRDTVVVLGLAP
jgi:hypothetical protein